MPKLPDDHTDMVPCPKDIADRFPGLGFMCLPQDTWDEMLDGGDNLLRAAQMFVVMAAKAKADRSLLDFRREVGHIERVMGKELDLSVDDPKYKVVQGYLNRLLTLAAPLR